MLLASTQFTTPSASTSHMSEILSLMDWLSGRSLRSTSASGEMPSWRSIITECWVGFVLSSWAAAMYGTSETWMNMQFSGPRSRRTSRAASMNGWDSMSPTVPPISVMITSTSSEAWARMRDLISLVMCGITCTHWPRYSPARSLRSTSW